MHTHPTDTPATARPAGSLDQDVSCPLCEYNLRGLTEPRCPECGFRFDWPDLLDPARKTHPYLFEHHPRHSIWSFCRTLLGAQFPRRFWSKLHPAQPSRPRRLIAYWVILTLPVLTLFTLHLIEVSQRVIAANAANRAWLTASLSAPNSGYSSEYWKRLYPTSQAFLNANYPATLPIKSVLRQALYLSGSTVGVGLIALLWAPLTFLALQIFRISMRRARIRPVHVLRCIIYSFDTILPWALLSAAAVAIEPFLFPPPPFMAGTPTQLSPWILLAWLFFAAIAGYRLAIAYARYLRFDHPGATIAASQVIVLLVIMNAIVFIDLLT